MIAKQKQNAPQRVALCLLMALSPSVSFADWTGGYAGLTVADLVDSQSIIERPQVGDIETELNADISLGAIGGYQVQQGDWVLGGELAISVPSDIDVREIPSGNVAETEVRQIDLKARAGYDLDTTLVYGVIGISQAQQAFENGDSITLDGFNIGFGADYLLNDQFVIGAEYLFRQLDGEDTDASAVEADTSTIALRASYKF